MSSKRITKKLGKSTSLVDEKRVIVEKPAQLLGRFYVDTLSDKCLRRLRLDVEKKKGAKAKIRITAEGITLIEYYGSVLLSKGPPVRLPVEDTEDVYMDDESEGIIVIAQALKNKTYEIIFHRVRPDDAATLIHGFNIIRIRRSSRPDSNLLAGYELELPEPNEGNWTFRSTDNKHRASLMTYDIHSANRKEISNDDRAESDGNLISTRYGDSTQKSASRFEETSYSGQTVATKQASNSVMMADHADGDIYATVDRSAKMPKQVEDALNSMRFDSESDDDSPPPPLPLGGGFNEERSTNVEYQQDGDSTRVITTETVIQRAATTEQMKSDQVLEEMRSKIHDASATNGISAGVVQGQAVTTTYTERTVVQSSSQGGVTDIARNQVVGQDGTLTLTHDNGGFTTTTTQLQSAPPEPVVNATVNADDYYESPVISSQNFTQESVFISGQPASLTPPPPTVLAVQGDAPPVLTTSERVLDSTVTVQEAMTGYVQTSAPVSTQQQYMYSDRTVTGQVLPAMVAMEEQTHVHVQQPDDKVLVSTVTVADQQQTRYVQPPLSLESRNYNSTVLVQSQDQGYVQQVLPAEPRVLSSTVSVQNQQHGYVQQVPPQTIAMQDDPRVLNATVVEETRTASVVPQQLTYVQQTLPQTQTISMQRDPRMLNATVIEERRTTVAPPQPQTVVVGSNAVFSDQYNAQVSQTNQQIPDHSVLNSQVVKVTKTTVNEGGDQVPRLIPNNGNVITDKREVNTRRSDGDGQEMHTNVVKEITRTETKQQPPIAAVYSNGEERSSTVTHNTQRQTTHQLQEVPQQYLNGHHQQHQQQHMSRNSRTTTTSRASQSHGHSNHGGQSLKRAEFHSKAGVAMPLSRHHRYYSVRSTGVPSSVEGYRQPNFETASQYSTLTRRGTTEYVDKPIEKCYERRRSGKGSTRLVYVERPALYLQRPQSSEIHHRVSKTPKSGPVHYINPVNVLRP